MDDEPLPPRLPFDDSIFDLSTTQRTQVQPSVQSSSSSLKRDSAGNLIANSLSGVDSPDAKKPKQRIPRNTVKLDDALLTSANGLPKLRSTAEKLKFKGKGHEAEDLKKLISFYQIWAHNLYPSLAFESVVEKTEKVCRTQKMDNFLSEMRREERLKGLGLIEDEIGKENDASDATERERLARLAEDKSRDLQMPENPRSNFQNESLFPDDDIDDDDLVMASETISTKDAANVPSGSKSNSVVQPARNDDDDDYVPITVVRKIRKNKKVLTLEEELFSNDDNDTPEETQLVVNIPEPVDDDFSPSLGGEMNFDLDVSQSPGLQRAVSTDVSQSLGIEMNVDATTVNENEMEYSQTQRLASDLAVFASQIDVEEDDMDFLLAPSVGDVPSAFDPSITDPPRLNILSDGMQEINAGMKDLTTLTSSELGNDEEIRTASSNNAKEGKHNEGTDFSSEF
ncbi:hypothetical protein HK098_002675 [Nowakowskiella sp. JEL0407]|nr:hypothetical protein HK098_002675 [Nowakowskiella sp. JEL0407]